VTGAARAKPAEALLPAADCDLLSGRDAIARWFGLTCGQCDARIRDGSIVTFKLPNRSTTYALKYENMRSWKAAARIVSSTERGRITLIFVAVKSARLVMDLTLSLSTMMAGDRVLAVAVSP
jgi:hypothetical protein